MSIRVESRSNGCNDSLCIARQAQSSAQLQLNTNSPASSIANVVLLTRRETALGYNGTDVALCEFIPNAKLQVRVEATNLNLRSLSQTAMNRNDMVAHR